MARLLFFGRLSDLAGGRVKDFGLPAGCREISSLINVLTAADQVLGEALNEPSVRIAVNEKMAARDAAISDSDEIAFLPPASGG